MKKMIIILFLFITSCGQKETDDKFENKMYLNNNYSANKIFTDESIVGKGFSSVEKAIKENCLENTSFDFHHNNKSSVMYYNDLSIDELSKELNININGDIDKYLPNINSELSYLQRTSPDSLTLTSTLISKVHNGYFLLKKMDKRILGFKVNDLYKSIIDKKKSEFIKICGDEVIEKQQLSAYLVFTASIEFESLQARTALKKVLGEKGDIFTEMNMDSDEKSLLLSIDEKMRKQIKINLFGFQLGGDTRLIQPVLKKRTCLLSNIEECILLFKKVHSYASENFIDQLDYKHYDKWITSEIKTKQYSKFMLLDSNSSYLSDQFNFGIDYAKFSSMLIDINRKNVNLIIRFKWIVEHDYMHNYSKNEIQLFKKNIEIARNNLTTIDNIFSECNTSHGLHECVSKYNQNNTTLLPKIDDDLINYKKQEHIDTYSLGTEIIETKNGFYFKKTLDLSIFDERKKIDYVLMDINDYEVTGQGIELICKKDFRKKYESVPSIYKYGIYISHWPLLLSLIDISGNDEFQRLDVIWNKKRSDILKKDIIKYCGEKSEIFFLTKEGSSISKVILRRILD